MVFLLYELLQFHRDATVVTLLHRIPREVRAYSRVPRRQLRESIERIYDATIDRVVSGDNTRLAQIFEYVARARVAQGFPMSAVLRAFMCAGPAIRSMLQRECRALSGDGLSQFNQAIALIEQIQSEALLLLVEGFDKCDRDLIAEHEAYLKNLNAPVMDRSRQMVFRG